MTSPALPEQRQLLHRRNLAIEVFERADGLFDVEAQLSDVKTRDMQLATGLRQAGAPIHDMGLRLTVDRALNVKAAESFTLAMPYPGRCDALDGVYGQLVGLNLLQGFRAGLKARLAGVQGCTHLTELAGVLPTAVIQAFAGYILDTREGSGDEQPPYQIDRCHALKRDSAVVQTYYPRWYRLSPASA